MNRGFYDWLLAQAEGRRGSSDIVEEVVIGLVWTLCRTQNGAGVAMTPQAYTRTLDFPGTLAGRTLAELTGHVRGHEPFAATAAMAAINSLLTYEDMGDGGTLRLDNSHGNLAVFDHFLPAIKGANIVVVGRYPGLEPYEEQYGLKVLERRPGPADYPDTAAPSLLPDADWIFLTASSIPNQTFPRLAELARDARVVLMGPTTPWLAGLRDWGIDYLAGIEVSDQMLLRRTVAEGGGRNIFRQAVTYRVADLSLHR